MPSDRIKLVDPNVITYNVAPDQRLDRLQAALTQAQRDRQDAASYGIDSWDRHVLAMNVEKLQAAVENEKKQQAIRTEAEGELKARQNEHDAEMAARREAARVEAERIDKSIEWSIYRQANPGATEAQFEAAYPQILTSKAAAKRDQLLASARAKYVV